MAGLMTRDEERLIGDAQQGDRSAFDHLVQKHRERLTSFVRSRLGGGLREWVEVEDVFQEAFLRGFRSMDRFQRRGEDSFFQWLCSIAECVIRDWARQRKRRPSVPLDGDIVGSSSGSPSNSLRRDVRFNRLQEALRLLSPDHREVIQLALLEGLRIKDIAQRMDRSPDAIKQLLLRATRKLRSHFGETESLHLPPRSLDDYGAQNEQK